MPPVGIHTHRPAVYPQKRRKTLCGSFGLHEEKLDWNSIGRSNLGAFNLCPRCSLETRQTRERLGCGICLGVKNEALGCIEQCRANAGKAAVRQHDDLGM